MEHRAFPDLRVHVDLAVVPVDDLAHDGESQTRPARLGGEEGREDLVEHILRDPAARIGDVHAHPVLLDHLGGHPDHAALGHHLDPVADEVAHGLAHLVGIDVDDRVPGVEVLDHLDVRREGVDGEEFLEEEVDGHDLELELARAGVGQDLVDDAVGLLDLGLDDGDVAADLGLDLPLLAELGLDEEDRVVDDGQGVADLVADHGGHLSDGGQTLLLDQLVLGGLKLPGARLHPAFQVFAVLGELVLGVEQLPGLLLEGLAHLHEGLGQVPDLVVGEGDVRQVLEDAVLEPLAGLLQGADGLGDVPRDGQGEQRDDEEHPEEDLGDLPAHLVGGQVGRLDGLLHVDDPAQLLDLGVGAEHAGAVREADLAPPLLGALGHDDLEDLRRQGRVLLVDLVGVGVRDQEAVIDVAGHDRRLAAPLLRELLVEHLREAVEADVAQQDALLHHAVGSRGHDGDRQGQSGIQPLEALQPAGILALLQRHLEGSLLEEVAHLGRRPEEAAHAHRLLAVDVEHRELQEGGVLLHDAVEMALLLDGVHLREAFQARGDVEHGLEGRDVVVDGLREADGEGLLAAQRLLLQDGLGDVHEVPPDHPHGSEGYQEEPEQEFEGEFPPPRFGVGHRVPCGPPRVRRPASWKGAGGCGPTAPAGRRAWSDTRRRRAENPASSPPRRGTVRSS